MTRCPKCNRMNRDGDRFCMYCGGPLQARTEASEVCKRCGQRVPEGHSFCQQCGAPTAWRQTEAVQNCGVESASGIRCAACGARMQGDSAFCPFCGKRVEKPERPVGPQAYGANRCAYCGRPLRQDMLFCQQCGTPVERENREYAKTVKPAVERQEPTQGHRQERTVRQQVEEDELARKKETRKVILWTSIAAVFVIGCILFFALAGPNLFAQPVGQTASPSPSPTPALSPTPSSPPSPTPASSSTPTPSVNSAKLPNGDADPEEIILRCNRSYLSDADIANLTDTQFNYVRNGIFALSGMSFNSGEYAAYFQSKSWYHPTTSDDDAVMRSFNRYQTENLNRLLARGRLRGIYPSYTPSPYLLPNGDADPEASIRRGDQCYMPASEFQAMTDTQLNYMRHGIFALSGKTFGSDEYGRYFSGKDWYQSKYDTDEQAYAQFNDYQKANLRKCLEESIERGLVERANVSQYL